ncbi:MAG: hypothetical protein IJL32_09275 [Oscillospiraceae bacterium]|nr:hypothetical protein [Oscillospiraceae bacterium]
MELLRDRYTDINNLCDAVQKALDQANGLHLKPQRAPFEEARAHKIGHSTADQTVPEKTQQRRSRSATETMTRSMHDDRMQAEAKFRSRAGLKCYITRKAVSGCCAWCTAMAGRYEYGEEPDDVYRRHDNCDCTVTFENGRKRQDVWSKREWEAPEPGAGAGDPVVFTKEQAEALQKEKQLSVLNNERISNQSRAISIFNDYEVPDGAFITSQSIIDNMQTTSIGKEILDYIESVDEVFIRLDHKTVRVDANDKPIYGEEVQGDIVVYLLMCENAERAARTVIHECTHRRYGIGRSQWAECVCFAQELKHKYKRDYLTFDEKKRIIKAVQEGYPEYNWRKGGLINGERQSHYRPPEKR